MATEQVQRGEGTGDRCITDQYIYVLVVLDNGQTWPKDLKISSLNRFCRDKKIVTNSFLEIIVRYVLENSLKSSKKKMWLQIFRIVVIYADIQNCCLIFRTI